MRKADIFYVRVDEFWRKEEKYRHLEGIQYIGNINWQSIQPDKNFTWLTEGLNDEFETFIVVGDKEAKSSTQADSEVIFKMFSNGVQTSRDVWAYNFNPGVLIQKIQLTIDNYNGQVHRWLTQRKQGSTVDSFVLYDDTKIKWSSRLKECLKSKVLIKFELVNVRRSLYRPFTFQYLYFDNVLTHRRGQFPSIFPTSAAEEENQIICLTGAASEKPFMLILSNRISDLHLNGAGCSTQCFPFYTYDTDGTNRRENITDWALEQFRTHYQDNIITKWDIFHYTYAVLHHPLYRERYAANLKRELPRLPYTPDFHAFARAGERLAEIHVEYEQQPEYPLRRVENNDLPLDWQVEKMKLTKFKEIESAIFSTNLRSKSGAIFCHVLQYLLLVVSNYFCQC